MAERFVLTKKGPSGRYIDRLARANNGKARKYAFFSGNVPDHYDLLEFDTMTAAAKWREEHGDCYCGSYASFTYHSGPRYIHELRILREQVGSEEPDD